MNPTDVPSAGRSGPTMAPVRKNHPREPAPRSRPAGDNPVLRAQSRPRQTGSSLAVASEGAGCSGRRPARGRRRVGPGAAVPKGPHPGGSPRPWPPIGGVWFQL